MVNPQAAMEERSEIQDESKKKDNIFDEKHKMGLDCKVHPLVEEVDRSQPELKSSL